MAIPIPTRFIQIGRKINAGTATAQLYTPGSATVLGTQILCQGSNLFVNLCASIRSIPASTIPFLDPLWTSLERQTAMANFAAGPRIGILFYTQKLAEFSNSPIFGTSTEIGVVELFNTYPFYNETSKLLEELYIQAGWGLFCTSYDLGYGHLRDSDYVSLVGRIEETSSFLQDADDTVYNFINRAI